MPALGEAEGHGQVGAHRAPRDRSGVRVHPGREIHRDHDRAAVIEVAERIHAVGGERFGDAARTGPEQGVECEIPLIARAHE